MDRSAVDAGTTGYSPPSRTTIPPFEALRAFDAMARLGGIRNAARNLGRDHAVISRHLKTLEQWTGAKLIERTPTGVVLTEDGLRYHKQIATAMDAIAASTVDLMRSGLHNHLYVSCSPGFALHWMSRRIGIFEKLNPDVEIELRPSDHGQDTRFFEADVEIRFIPCYRPQAPSAVGVRWQEIITVPIVAVASPEYLDDKPPIVCPSDLIGHRLLHEHDFNGWAQWLVAHGVYDDFDLTGTRLWQGHLTLDAALCGRGIALMNYLVADNFIKSGQLVEIGKGCPQFQTPTEGKYFIFTRSDRWDQPLIRRYRRWLVDNLNSQFSRPKLPIYATQPS
ncbi:MAG: LysR substrate-binding domain-containing protein [Asticcacaulis sp.]|uniref:LysR substrate-binding domain-containing protein n=1 Tax=Asticcacaulis sp. TaxID=1872648 RepID=UPI0039E66600